MTLKQKVKQRVPLVKTQRIGSGMNNGNLEQPEGFDAKAALQTGDIVCTI